MQFPGFVGGGFECSSHVRGDGRRLDLVRGTGHDRLAKTDFAQLRAAGMRWARSGLRWHLIEPSPGVCLWDSWLPQLDAAATAGVDTWWDLVHFGVPDWCDIWSPGFPARAAEFAAAAALLHRRRTGRPMQVCPVNEISFMAFAGGDMAWMYPHARGCGRALKAQLVGAAIAMARAIREVEPGARLMWAEPLIHVACTDPVLQPEADCRAASQYEATDWILGRERPELGGDPSFADVLGWNHYPHNQAWVTGEPAAFGTPGFKALSDLLETCAARYPRHPLVLAETGAEGPARAAWLHYVGQETMLARAKGVPVAGACLYPVTDYPGWDNDRICPTGLFGMPDGGSRPVDLLTLEAVQAIERRITGLANGPATAPAAQPVQAPPSRPSARISSMLRSR
jgi:hypothetical protein